MIKICLTRLPLICYICAHERYFIIYTRLHNYTSGCNLVYPSSGSVAGMANYAVYPFKGTVVEYRRARISACKGPMALYVGSQFTTSSSEGPMVHILQCTICHSTQPLAGVGVMY